MGLELHMGGDVSLPTPLVIRRNPDASDESLVDLNEDQKAASDKAIGEVIGAVQFVREGVKDDSLTVSRRHNCLYVAKADLKRVFTLLGEDDSEKTENDMLRSALQAANAEVGRLKLEMSRGVGLEAVSHKLTALDKVVERWWKSLGFGYTDGKFLARYSNPHYKVTLSGHLDLYPGCSEEDTPVSAKARKTQTAAELAKVCDMADGNGEDKHVLDTPRSRQYLTEQLMARFPGAFVTEFRSMALGWHGKTGFYIRELEVHIPIQSIREIDENPTV